MSDSIAQQVLDTPIDGDSIPPGITTIREYLIALLAELWLEGESFSGKRPFGDSGWTWDIQLALVKEGHITGQLDEDGYLDDCDHRHGHRLILAAIRALGEPR